MGWNSWNHFRGNIDANKFKAIVDAFVTSGLRDAGYRYLVIDDGWMGTSRDKDGNLVPVASKFPSGMKALGDYAHAKGLKFGIYSCPTKKTCMYRAGGYGHEAQDARAFASWGVDFLKYDWCGVQSGEDANGGVAVAEVKRRFAEMRDALKATGRPIVYSLSEKGQGTRGVVPGTWQDTVGHMWRIGYDINPNWEFITGHIDQDADLAEYAGPGGWNDPDMMEVGNGLSDAENRMHFSAWCILAAPLMIGNDPSSMTAAVKDVLTNKEAIAVDQDSLGAQGVRIKGKGALEVWVKPLAGGDKAVMFLNRTSATATISVQWTDSLIRWGAGAKVNVRDLWKHSDSLVVAQGLSAQVPSHDAALFRLKRSQVSALRDGGSRSGLVLAWTGRGPGLFLPPEEKAGLASFLDFRGRVLFSLPVRGGWNALPGPFLERGVVCVRIANPDHVFVRRLALSR